jgi:hypothetical protein
MSTLISFRMYFIGFGVILTLVSCGCRKPTIDLDKRKISEDVREMLNVYWNRVPS